MRAGWILSMLVGLPACRRAEPPSAVEDGVPDRYRFLGTAMVMEKDLPRVREQLPYERIELSEFSPWELERPEVSLGRDGTIVEGSPSSRTGRISIFDFGEVCYLIERSGFESMKPRYAWDGYDATTYTIKVSRVGNHDPITVEDYGSVGPADLWTLRTTIRGIESRALWK
jgi:hypothetical protein